MTFPDTTFTTGTTITSNWLNAVNDYCNESNPADHSSANVEYDPPFTGGVATNVEAKLAQTVSVKDFGAVGDGVTDDTAAIQAAFDTTSTSIYFPQGTYRVSDSITSSVANRIIKCDGKITATSAITDPLFTFTGDNTIVQLIIDGDDYIAKAIVIDAANCIVENCIIENLKNTSATCYAVFVNNAQNGVIVRNNIFRNMEAIGTGTPGFDIYTRAVSLDGSANSINPCIVENNLMENCLGDEGDSISIGFSNGAGTWYDANAIVKNNTIKNFTRRAIKLQCNKTIVDNNYITHDFASSAEVPNANAVIAMVQGGNHQISNNTLDACKWFSQITCNTNAPDSFNNIYVTGNTITGLASETTGTIIAATSLGDTFIVSNNNISCGTGRAISVGANSKNIIENNTITKCADNAAERVISISASATKSIVRGNVLLEGTRECFIASDGDNTVVSDNHLKCNTPMFMDALGNSNCLVINNSIDGTANLIADTDTNTGNRFGCNYQFDNQTNAYSGVLFTPTSTGPATSLAGKYVNAGQIVFDTTPTSGSYIGWVATTTGLAESVTWKQFGAIT